MGIFVVVDPDAPVFVHRYGNLADRQLGARALFVTNEFFAAVDRMLNPDAPVFIADKYDDNGKWMDGWETQRRRTCGYDYAIVKLFRPGVIFGVDMDTSYFVGNYPPAASMDACYCTDDAEVIRDGFEWTEIIASTALNPNKHHYVDVESRTVFTHVRVNIYPDGGLARLRIYGPPQCDWQMMRASNEPIDVAAMVNGAYVVAASNEAFGLASNMLRPGQASNMGGGWETRRRREPGHDWVIIALAHPAIIERIDVDTAFFKGNCPDRCSMHAAFVPEDARGRGGGNVASLITQSMFWQVLMTDQKLVKDSKHSFESDKLKSLGIVTHIRFNIIPDGGVSRLRIWGNIQ